MVYLYHIFALTALVLEVQIVPDGMFAPLHHLVPAFWRLVSNVFLIMVP